MIFCWFGIFRQTREFLTHMETSPLPVKGCIIWPMLGTYGHWAVRVPSPHLLWHGAFIYNGQLQGPVTLTPNAECLAVDLSLPVITLSRLEFEHPTFRLQNERSNPLRHRRGLFKWKGPGVVKMSYQHLEIFSRIIASISTKFCTNHSWVKGIQAYIKWGAPFRRG